ncbi:MAG: hypothetical protein K2I96_11490 [Lachnospiraceae bacterium]|nr:hypothetical protein [Lachnospiraceae bacterium]
MISSEQGNDAAGVIAPDAEQEEVHIVLSTGENAMDLVVLPAEDTDSALEKSGVGRILLIALGCAAGVGMVVVGVVGFRQIRRDDSE